MTDMVNHPSHYIFENGVEVLDLVEQLPFNKGSIVKYVARSGRKDPRTEVQDLEKAAMLLAREIKRAKIRHLKALQEPKPKPVESPELGNPIPRCEALHLGNAGERCIDDAGHSWSQHQSIGGVQWRTPLCGVRRSSKLGLVDDAVCELEAGHATWHEAHGSTWPS